MTRREMINMSLEVTRRIWKFLERNFLVQRAMLDVIMVSRPHTLRLLILDFVVSETILNPSSQTNEKPLKKTKRQVWGSTFCRYVTSHPNPHKSVEFSGNSKGHGSPITHPTSQFRIPKDMGPSFNTPIFECLSRHGGRHWVPLVHGSRGSHCWGSLGIHLLILTEGW